MNVYKISGGKQKVSAKQIKGFTNWKVQIKCKKMNEGRNICKITKSIMSGSESRISTCKYKDVSVIDSHNVLMWRLCHEDAQCTTLLTKRKKLPNPYVISKLQLWTDEILPEEWFIATICVRDDKSGASATSQGNVQLLISCLH
jgi:hypothetical protein